MCPQPPRRTRSQAKPRASLDNVTFRTAFTRTARTSTDGGSPPSQPESSSEASRSESEHGSDSDGENSDAWGGAEREEGGSQSAVVAAATEQPAQVVVKDVVVHKDAFTGETLTTSIRQKTLVVDSAFAGAARVCVHLCARRLPIQMLKRRVPAPSPRGSAPHA